MMCSITPRPKPQTYRNKAFMLRYVDGKTCLACFRSRATTHHHDGMGVSGGTGLKAHDYMTVPVCAECHDRIHRGESLINDKVMQKFMAGNILDYIADMGDIRELILLLCDLAEERQRCSG